ncbi:hypothetical protein ACX8XP_03690 [Calditrichota bacterium LG25]
MNNARLKGAGWPSIVNHKTVRMNGHLQWSVIQSMDHSTNQLFEERLWK